MSVLLRIGYIFLAGLGISSSAVAEKATFLGGQFSGRATLASDYVFRGESETADGEIPAIQIDFSWTHSSNWYTGIFASTNRFTSAPDVDVVVAPYVGKSGDIGNSDFQYNVFVFHYMYPGVSELDYTELWINASKTFDKTTLGLEVTPTLNDWFGVEDWRGVNYAVHSTHKFNPQWSLSGSFGTQQLDGDGAEGWLHWNLGVKHNLAGLDLDLRYHDSDIDSSHKVYGSPSGLEIFEQRLVFGISKGF